MPKDAIIGTAMKRDVDWLKKSLAAALGWDEQLTEGVAEAIAAAGSRHEVEELTQVITTNLIVRDAPAGRAWKYWWLSFIQQHCHGYRIILEVPTRSRQSSGSS